MSTVEGAESVVRARRTYKIYLVWILQRNEAKLFVKLFAHRSNRYLFNGIVTPISLDRLQGTPRPMHTVQCSSMR